MKLGEAMYQAQQGETAAAEGQGAHNDDGVVDAEFEEVKDDKQSA
jgi:molecular chaperone DnaK